MRTTILATAVLMPILALATPSENSFHAVTNDWYQGNWSNVYELAQIRLASIAVSTQLGNCVSALPTGDRGRPEHMIEFGMPNGLTSPESALGLLVSNNIDAVYSNFSSIATTRVEKMLLLASAWRLGDAYYLDCLSRNVDLAAAGEISSDELRWFMRGHRTRHLTYILADRYDSPGVSNIVQRLIAYTGETNRYEKVLSGEAKAEYLAFEEFMRTGPESPVE